MSPALASPPQRFHDQRILFTAVRPQIEDGRYPVKRLQGQTLKVSATVFRDEPASLGVQLLWKHESAPDYHTVPMEELGNDRWSATFPLEQLGLYTFTLEAWSDTFANWRRGLQRKQAAGDPDLRSELLEGAALLRAAAARVERSAQPLLLRTAALLADDSSDLDAACAAALEEPLLATLRRFPDRARLVAYERILSVVVDRPRAGFAAWYELFPRSQAEAPGQHGTLRDVLRRLPHYAELGFDVLYFPPIHPIGRTHRKGKNNSLNATAEDVGCPWAIGNEHGGHTAIEPALGSEDDLWDLVCEAQAHGIEIALDLALNCSPDHPYVRDHPEWFHHRPDGTIKYAENPPKKYQDIYPLNFDSPAWPALWQEWLRVVLHWAQRGIRTFRVDNPHTKPAGFWEWLISEAKREFPDLIFLSEAFTRPAMMHALAKLGFSQSYTYFTWRNTKAELMEYLGELCDPATADYFRPHFFANTPDILHAYLQTGGRPAFAVRLLLAATLSPLYGIFQGFEFAENTPLKPGSEEYLHSDKYELRHRPLDQPGSLLPLIRLVNTARRNHPALQELTNLQFHPVENPQLLAYSKVTGNDRIIVVVNLDPFRPQDGVVTLDLNALGLTDAEPFVVHDLISNNRWLWGRRNWVRLDPGQAPGHLLVVQTASPPGSAPSIAADQQHETAPARVAV